MKKTKVFIIILSYNGGEDTLNCLRSLMREKFKGMWVEILVVDNGSTDGSLEMIEKIKKNEKIKIIKNKRNLGFAAGMNVGVREALNHGAEAVLLLNQDTIVNSGFLKPLLENPADIVAPVIKFKREGKWFYDFGGKVDWWLGRPRHLESNTQYAIRDRERKKMGYVSGCAVLIKRPVLEAIGLLDESFFLYFEDVDFCLRARRAGFKIAVEPKSVIVHKLAEKKKKPLKQHLQLLKSNFIFISRYLSWWKKPLASFYLLALLLKIIWNQWR